MWLSLEYKYVGGIQYKNSLEKKVFLQRSMELPRASTGGKSRSGKY